MTTQRKILVMSLVNDCVAMSPVEAWTGYTLEEALRLVAWVVHSSPPADDSDDGTGPYEFSIPEPESVLDASLGLCDGLPDDFQPKYFAFDSGKRLPGHLTIGSCPAPGIVAVIHESTADEKRLRDMFGKNVVVEAFRAEDDFVPDCIT